MIFNTLIGSFAAMGDKDKCLKIVEAMTELQIPISSRTFRELVRMYINVRDFRSAVRTFMEATNDGHRFNREDAKVLLLGLLKSEDTELQTLTFEYLCRLNICSALDNNFVLDCRKLEEAGVAAIFYSLFVLQGDWAAGIDRIPPQGMVVIYGYDSRQADELWDTEEETSLTKEVRSDREALANLDEASTANDDFPEEEEEEGEEKEEDEEGSSLEPLEKKDDLDSPAKKHTTVHDFLVQFLSSLNPKIDAVKVAGANALVLPRSELVRFLKNTRVLGPQGKLVKIGKPQRDAKYMTRDIGVRIRAGLVNDVEEDAALERLLVAD